jgi:hypothetical protein
MLAEDLLSGDSSAGNHGKHRLSRIPVPRGQTTRGARSSTTPYGSIHI